MGTEAQTNLSQGLDGESEDSRPGRPRSFTHPFRTRPSLRHVGIGFLFVIDARQAKSEQFQELRTVPLDVGER